jgi:hypothetical protein
MPRPGANRYARLLDSLAGRLGWERRGWQAPAPLVDHSVQGRRPGAIELPERTVDANGAHRSFLVSVPEARDNP